MQEGRTFDALRTTTSDVTSDHLRFTPHSDYDSYLRIHKILVGKATAHKLETIYENLSREKAPRYLSAAGWAATEAALSQPNAPAKYRNGLLQKADVCWQQALQTQLDWNATEKEHLVEHSAPYHYALDLAHLPLIQAMVSGDITKAVRESVAVDVLNIAEANAIQMNLALRSGDRLAVSDHVGVGHECNALLAFHSLKSPSLFAIPSSARADSGHHHPHQTHDLLVVQQKWGTILEMTPAEIKAKTSQNDRRRYKALLVRGKMHLSVEGRHSPEHTLRAFSAFFNNRQTPTERMITDHARQTILDLYWLYKKGDRLRDFASNTSRCQYRDASTLQAQHPEIAPDFSLQ